MSLNLKFCMLLLLVLCLGCEDKIFVTEEVTVTPGPTGDTTVVLGDDDDDDDSMCPSCGKWEQECTCPTGDDDDDDELDVN